MMMGHSVWVGLAETASRLDEPAGGAPSLRSSIRPSLACWASADKWAVLGVCGASTAERFQHRRASTAGAPEAGNASGGHRIRIGCSPDPDRVNTGSGGQHGDMGNMMMSCYVMLHDGAVIAWKGC
jgi:hypothetical protein